MENGFFDELRAVASTGNTELHRNFIHQHKSEITELLLHFHSIGLVGGATSEHIDPPIQCDLCNDTLVKNGMFVDGETLNGGWANMCGHCYGESGMGIGWGIGQLYMLDRNQSWICLFGGEPACS